MISLRKLNLGLTAWPCSLLRIFPVNGASIVFRQAIQSGWSNEIVNRSVGFFWGNIGIQSRVDRTAFAQTAPFSTIAGTILVQAQDIGKMSEELENVIDENKLDDAWALYVRHIQMAGFPRKTIVNKLVAAFAESSDLGRLESAYGMIEQAFEESKHDLLERNTLIYLSLAFAKCGSPIPASTLVRKLVETERYPPVSAWSAILAYMSQTSTGAYLAVELVLEIGYLFQDGRVDPRKKSNESLLSMKPNATCFNIALVGCLLFGTTRKAEQLLDMMPRINLKADATLLIIMAHIYEKNGRREEFNKLKRDMEEAPNVTEMQFRQFYNCLLSCYLKFGDLESTSHMVLEMLRKAEKAKNSLGTASLLLEASRSGDTLRSNVLTEDAHHRKPDGSENWVSYEDLCRDRKFSELQTIAKNLLDVLVIKLQKQIEFITTEHGILQPTEKLYVKLVKAFLEVGRTKDLAEFLIKAAKEDSPVSVDDSALVHVINSCISLGWLDQAHDLLDEMRLAGVRTGSSVYTSLLKAYCKENRAGEVASLLRDARRAGIQIDASCYEVLIQSKVIQKDSQGALHLFKEMKEAKIPRAGHQEFEKLVKGSAEGGEASLMVTLLHEIKEGKKVDYGVHDWNNVIHFFCKKRLMQDAEKAFKKMRSLGHAPNAQTFHSLVTGYATIGGKYVEVTELWGEMKSIAFSYGMKFDQELLDAVLYTFVRGGFFVRANEVVEMMEKGNMFIDKYKYRALFLKYHKTLYKGKSPKFQSESQMKKREAALNFKRWAGLC
ncbi:Pentatricopeptide repeat-containing protein, mitochondrial [Capsicum annuum]|uniref:Pentatricopeptide repeat-containing protein, mitochondrial n=1 Tax=Capsicum annuum TaxID=4072 RepID=A0A1U8GMK9_CAPAN|nr:pentatricopeptide repeat-containing protein At1g03100, mitochondrial [Capsicum annuum]XP_016572486.1 pentatricopeptide repeat-containing protein At1g03100, mitochondrial [Capsicum annuum]XP_016572487.1 pentatricopeptide repeat-containing protein At1g03100, mitochondrial [Capsicum annuum]XP_047268899.1 pentatricopeptide repeat-containing protein At1g03100, mitochondrial [Capsicum annuum]KAF3617808.1 Pentatricopeptide repeat-containing protein, mitochondrial [Capsicum annuum]KAF3652777.1 Pent